MPVSTSNLTNGIGIKLTAYHNCDDVQLFWRPTVNGQPDVAIPGCLGFAIARRRKTSADVWGATEVLRNRVGFSNQLPVGADGLPQYLTKPSSIWPFQRYDWTDHGANSGQTVMYRVTAVGLPQGQPGDVELQPIADSGWTEAIRVDANSENGISAYFNRGTVMSQYVARIARKNDWSAVEIKEHIAELEEPLRRFLAGELRIELLRLLDEVIENPDLSFYAALYELSDNELIQRLQLLRGRAHIVLSNGSDTSGDENAAARATLNAADVDVHNRMLGSKGLGHNKFAVVVRTLGKKALKAWTGSTNWASTGLCTQLNNGILIENEAVAQAYLSQWDRLAIAGNGFPADLVSANAASPQNVDNINVWFTRVRNSSPPHAEPGADIKTLIELVNSAQSIILYIMFQPGLQPLASILLRAQEPNMVVKGVVSTVTSTNQEQFTLLGVDRESKEYKTALIQPEGIGKSFSAWVEEVTRREFLTTDHHEGIGHAITHAKMIVIDPFSDNCKVITGSHNFSKAASEKNDENFVVIHGNKALAEAYSVACLATYEHYRWRAYVKEQFQAGLPIWDHLSASPEWQEQCLSDGVKQTLSLWCP
ncbi:MAG TPA: phospholipase D-like domain-containing protein [Pyrinomonadaceae bacterium]|nr:phospholipase D-like domain-containing protein [Pyrinomonadaceae bacterium]